MPVPVPERVRLVPRLVPRVLVLRAQLVRAQLVVLSLLPVRARHSAV